MESASKNLEHRYELDPTQIHLKGWENLEIGEFSLMQSERLIVSYLDRFKFYVDEELELTVHLKQYDTTGTKRKSSFHLKLAYPGKVVTSTASGWNFKKALHQGLDALEAQLKTMHDKEKQF